LSAVSHPEQDGVSDSLVEGSIWLTAWLRRLLTRDSFWVALGHTFGPHKAFRTGSLVDALASWALSPHFDGRHRVPGPVTLDGLSPG